MSDPSNEPTTTSWSVRPLLHRLALALAAAVGLGVVAPALASAAGADVRTPVSVLLSSFDDDEPADDGAGKAKKDKATKAPGADDTAEAGGEHGRIVSTVAHCAPRGQDPLFTVTGDDLQNHGAFVRVAAHGDVLTTDFGTFDLGTLAGAERLCTTLERMSAELEAEAGEDAAAKAKKAKREKPAKDHGNRPGGAAAAGDAD